jgi:hypothetical protein
MDTTRGPTDGGDNPAPWAQRHAEYKKEDEQLNEDNVNPHARKRQVDKRNAALTSKKLIKSQKTSLHSRTKTLKVRTKEIEVLGATRGSDALYERANVREKGDSPPSSIRPTRTDVLRPVATFRGTSTIEAHKATRCCGTSRGNGAEQRTAKIHKVPAEERKGLTRSNETTIDEDQMSVAEQGAPRDEVQESAALNDTTQGEQTTLQKVATRQE